MPKRRRSSRGSYKALREALGPALRELRQTNGLSQADLATAAGKSPAEISRLERTSPNVRLNTIVQFLDPLGVSLTEFFAAIERNRSS